MRFPHIPNIPFRDAQFSLDASGVAGFFGGEEAVYAMGTVHVYEGRKWLGWFNSPGSYEIGRRYGKLAKSRLWNGLFPGVNVDPAVLFELHGKVGPKYIAAFSGTVMQQTGHCAALLAEHTLHPKLYRSWAPLLAAIPISASFGTCVLCFIFQDWYSFSMILLGIITSGLACFVIGSGKLTYTHPEPAKGAPRGDGMLVDGNEMVIVKGEEGAVNSVTRGRFLLKYDSEPEYWSIGMCSILLIIQFLAQLLLIPQGTLFGQLMFIISLGVSWVYNMYLCSLDGEKIQSHILLKEVLREPQLTSHSLGTRTSAVVFALLVLRPPQLKEQLDSLLPNDTKVWRRWKEEVLKRIESRANFGLKEADLEVGDFEQDEGLLLQNLFNDAQSAYEGYLHYEVRRQKRLEGRHPLSTYGSDETVKGSFQSTKLPLES